MLKKEKFKNHIRSQIMNLKLFLVFFFSLVEAVKNVGLTLSTRFVSCPQD